MCKTSRWVSKAAARNSRAKRRDFYNRERFLLSNDVDRFRLCTVQFDQISIRIRLATGQAHACILIPLSRCCWSHPCSANAHLESARCPHRSAIQQLVDVDYAVHYRLRVLEIQLLRGGTGHVACTATTLAAESINKPDVTLSLLLLPWHVRPCAHTLARREERA